MSVQNLSNLLLHRFQVQHRSLIMAVMTMLVVTAGWTVPLVSNRTAVGKEYAAEEMSGGSETRLREDSIYRDRGGVFILTGDRVRYVSSDKQVDLFVLENLSLERVINEVSKLGNGQKWDIQGVVTEFRDKNYLLLNRAIIVRQEKRESPLSADVEP